MDTLQRAHSETAGSPAPEAVSVQSGSYLLELSLDWIVRRASENIHHLLRQSHVTLIDEPLGRFVHAQALHDVRNLFSRLSGTTGICRAYAVRLTDECEFVDIAFHMAGGRVILEAVPAAPRFGEAFGTVGGLVSGLAANRGQSLLDGVARRMRALTGYDRVALICGERRAESSRGAFAGPFENSPDLPAMVSDSEGDAVAIFPGVENDQSTHSALLRTPSGEIRKRLRDSGVRSTLRVPFSVAGVEGEFRCENRTPHRPSFEIHAAAELFAQMAALRLETDALEARG